MIKAKLAAILLAVLLLAAGCGQTDRVACADLDRIGGAVDRVSIEREAVEEEILGDVAEEKAVYNCEGYDAFWQDESE